MDCISNALREGATDVLMLDVYPPLPGDGPPGRTPRGRCRPSARPRPTRSTRAANAASAPRSPGCGARTAASPRCRAAGWRARRRATCMRSRAASSRSRPTSCSIAIGFSHPEHDGPVDELRVDLDAPRQHQGCRSTSTKIDGVFACGDARVGQSLVVTAIAEGRRCARVVDRTWAARARPAGCPRRRCSPSRTAIPTRCATRPRSRARSPSATRSGAVRATRPDRRRFLSRRSGYVSDQTPPGGGLLMSRFLLVVSLQSH